MPLSDGEFDTIVQAVLTDRPPVPAEPVPHRVLWFAVGLGLFAADACLGYVFVWLLAHG